LTSPLQQTLRSNVWTTRAVAALLLIVPVTDFLRLALPRAPQIDDAFISYRYAAHLVDGLGLVWNPGERVEGFSNPLWTLLVGAGLALGFDAEAVGHVLGVLGGLAILACTIWLARLWLPVDVRWLAPLALWPVAGSTALVYWSTAGLETALFVALAMASVVAFAKARFGWMALGLALVTLTRMDGVLLAAVLFGFQLAHFGQLGQQGQPGSRRSAAFAALRPGLAYAISMALALSARLVYYGTLVPNTYWAKVGGVPMVFGSVYVGKFFAAGAIFLVPAAAIALVRLPATRAIGVYVCVAIVYAISIGGDAFPHSRFLLVVLPLLAVLATVGVALLWQSARPRVALAAAAALVLACVWPIAVGTTPGIEMLGERPRAAALESEWRHAAYMVDLQRRRSAILRQGPRPDLIAAGAIGALGYFSELPVLDILGLTDPHIARSRVGDRTDGLPIPGHARSDADYVFAMKPDFLFVPRKGEGPVWMFALQDIWQHPEFERRYVWDDALQGYRRVDPSPSADTGSSTATLGNATFGR
jgi:arabinofuranosyltransferase